MAADIDVRAIAIFASVSESVIHSILSQPTADSVNAFLQGLAPRARHCDEMKAQKIKLEVELETVVRTNESKVKVLQNTRDKALGETGQLRQDLQTAESKRLQLQADLERAQQSTESDASEFSLLRSKIASLETSHRDTLALFDTKSKEVDRLAQDLTNEHQKVVDLRKEVSRADQEKQQAISKANAAVFKQTSLQQELDLQKKNIDWYESEHKAKGEEHQKFRREKNARLSELQQSLDRQIEQADTLRRSENALRSQLEDQTRRADDLATAIQKLREKELADAEHNRMTVESLNRLADLHKASAETAKARVDELSMALEEAREDAAEEIGRIRAEVQDEHNEREAAEQRVTELETKLAQLEADVHEPLARPATPQFNANGQIPATPVRAGTPLASFTPRSTHKFKNSMSATQLYSDYTKLEKELVRERKEREQLQIYVDSMIEDLESSRPQMEQLHNDQARLQDEVMEMSQLADDAKAQRDVARKEASKLQGSLDKARMELDQTQQMSRDLASQVRRLLLEQQAGVLGDAEFERLTSELEEVNQRDMAHLSGPQQEVNQYLLRFRSIAELQTINETQLATIRNLVTQLESEDAKEVQKKHLQLEQDLRVANDKILNYQGEVERMVAQTKSFVKERDMFRSMLTRRGQIDPTDFSRSLPAGGFTTSVMSDRPVPLPSSDIDLAKLLKDLQVHFDNFRDETKTNATSLSTQITDLTQRNSKLQAESSKYLGHLEAATQKFEMLQSNHETLKMDYQALQKRAQISLETATRQELRTQQAAEELVEAKGLVDSLRRECANLKAEKDLWKTVEKRLVDDGETLRSERARLDQLNASLQNMINEKDHAESDSRRRYEYRIEILEGEMQTAKRKLEEEIEGNKQTALRRAYEHDQSQKRIDELISNLGTNREELAAIKSTRDQLQARIDEMTIELRSAEERLEVLARPSATPMRQAHEAEINSISIEQDLAVEVSELRRDLDLKSAELSKAEEHLEEYKSIAQEAEERLQQLVETNDEDKADLQAVLDEKDQKAKDFQQRVDDLSSELNSTISELSRLRDAHAECDRKSEEARAAHQTEIDRLQARIEKLDDDLALYKEATKEQQKIAEQRQQNYETELLKHTEAVKTVQAIRAEANQLRLEIAEYKTRAETATTDLLQKVSSWSDIENRYKQELMDVKNRREEVEQHSKSLYASLETLNTQLAALQKQKPVSSANEEDESVLEVSHDMSSLNEVIRYLRQEKEIIEVRHHMAASELERTKRQLESTQSSLDDTRLKLDQVQRVSIDVEKNAMSHNKLVETLNELNLYRESVVTLRAEKRNAEQALSESNVKLESVEQELIPLRSRIVEIEHLLELKQGEMDLLQKDRDSWQQRTQNILSKYDRVDPVELEEIKNKCAELEKMKDEALAAQSALQAQIDEFPEAIEAAKAEQKTRLTEQFKNRDRQMREQRSQLQAELNSKTEELEAALTREAEMSAQPAKALTPDADTSAPSDGALSLQVQELEAQVETLENAIKEKDIEITVFSAKQEEFKLREDNMKKRLNDRLLEVKKENEAKIESIKQEAEVRQQQIVDERLAEFRESTDLEKQTAVAEIRETLLAEHQAHLSSIASHNDAETEADFTVPQDFDDFVTNLTPAQAKILIQRNSTVSGIIKNNIRKGVSEIKDQSQQNSTSSSSESTEQQVERQVERRLAEELDNLRNSQEAEIDRRVLIETENVRQQGQASLDALRETLLRESKQSFEAEKQSLIELYEQEKKDEIARARASEQKMAVGKQNLLKSQAANSQAKLNVVKKAVEETPEKAVKDVWEVAKMAKPPPADNAPKPPTAHAPSAPLTSVTMSEPVKVQTGEDTSLGVEPKMNGNTELTSKAVTSQPEFAEDLSAPSQPTPTTSAQTVQNQAIRSTLPQPASGIPRGGLANKNQRGGIQGARGTGIPRPGSSIGNHGINTNVNGRGRGGRGAYNNPASPSRGGGALNPNASQFTPNKRPREDGADDGNLGKRIRGGGAGS